MYAKTKYRLGQSGNKSQEPIVERRDVIFSSLLFKLQISSKFRKKEVPLFFDQCIFSL